MKIWILFSIEDKHDQAERNLIAWWLHKPSFNQLKEAVDCKNFTLIHELEEGVPVDIGVTNYRLEEVKEGIYYENF